MNKGGILGLSNDVVGDLGERLENAIDNGANRGFSRLLSYVAAHVEHANPHDGVWSLPNGEALRASLEELYDD